MEIARATLEDMDKVGELFREYHQWLGIDLSFQDFESELINLPGCYRNPMGAIFLVKVDSLCVGCIGVRPHSTIEAELKRMFVTPTFRGKGFAWQLLVQAMHMVKLAGYQSVVLDTLPSMLAAKALYLKYGFVATKPYYNNPLPGTEYYRYVYS